MMKTFIGFWESSVMPRKTRLREHTRSKVSRCILTSWEARDRRRSGQIHVVIPFSFVRASHTASSLTYRRDRVYRLNAMALK